MTKYTQCYRRTLTSKSYSFKNPGSALLLQRGLMPTLRATPTNPTWEMFVPLLMPADTCKAMAYICKSLVDNHTIVHRPNHPLTAPHSVVLDIFKDPTLDDMPSLQVINVYHPLATNHSLGYLFHHHINNSTPILLIGDFN